MPSDPRIPAESVVWSSSDSSWVSIFRFALTSSKSRSLSATALETSSPWLRTTKCRLVSQRRTTSSAPAACGCNAGRSSVAGCPLTSSMTRSVSSVSGASSVSASPCGSVSPAGMLATSTSSPKYSRAVWLVRLILPISPSTTTPSSIAARSASGSPSLATTSARRLIDGHRPVAAR